MALRALTWNLYHGRDFPPDPALFTVRSRLLRLSERNATHLQVNRDLGEEFATVLAAGSWDVALLQECPPRWWSSLARASAAAPHATLTSRNALGVVRALLARLNPDLIGSDEGGSNLTLVRARTGTISERRELVLRRGPEPERRTMAFTRIELAAGGELCVANLHASAGRALARLAEEEVLHGAEHAVEWAAEASLVFGGDLNLRPAESGVYDELAARFGLVGPTAPDSLDHLLARRLEIVRPAAPWPAQRREVESGGLAIRLSDHAPVEAEFASARAPSGGMR
jgi:endonuclease/exonuclease/phosphatase family metal-dependent hydrolase